MAIRIICLLKRKPGLTAEEFQEYWSNHGRLFATLKYVRERIIRYSQLHVSATASGEMAVAGVAFAQADGVAEFWVEKVDDLLELFHDAEYQERAVPDEERFLDRESVQTLVGEDELHWERT